MPATSKSQQRLFGMIHAHQKNGTPVSKKLEKISDSIGDKAKDFAKTKHKGLPNHKHKSFKEWLKNNGN